ncbi:MAG: DNA/RNA nuclease SfsA [Desulfurococcaceae archaeon]
MNDYVETAKIIGRLNRFVVRIEINGETREAYLNNTGRLEKYITYGKKCFIVKNARGRLNYRILAVEDHGYGAVLDTSLQERVFEKLVLMNTIDWLKNCVLIRRNVRLNDSVIDYAFKCRGETVLVELKSAVLRLMDKYASYPDAPSSRASKQFLKLMNHVSNGGASIVVFICALPFIEGFIFNNYVDEKLYVIITNAKEAGVSLKAIQLYYDPHRSGVVIGNLNLPVYL